MSVEQPRIRRHATKTSSFKLINARLDTRSKGKTKNVQRDVGVESPEFQLLVRLYVPANLLITNNKVEIKELMKYLPLIVNDELPELNFELHIFLSCIVSRYVLSWYSLKLNTDDTKFISEVYLLLCDFVRDFSARVLKVVESPLLLHVINDVGNLLAKHIEDNRIENGTPKYFTDYLINGQNVLYDDDNFDFVKLKYLAASHAIFDPSIIIRESEKNSKYEPLNLYTRALSNNILTLTVNHSGSSNTVLSPIGHNFVSAILADLVFQKVIILLSRPEFILKNVIRKSMGSLKGSSSPKRVHITSSSIIHALKRKVNAILTFLNNIKIFWKQQAVSNNYPRLEFFFLVPLFDSIYSIKRRRHMTMSIGEMIVSVLFLVLGMKQKIETVVGSFLLVQIWQSALLEDTTLAGIVKNLRDSVFERTQTSKTDNEVSGTELLLATRDDLLSFFNQTVSSKLMLGYVSRWLTDEDASERDIKESIQNFLAIFNNGSSDQLHQESDINVLLAIRLIDCLIMYVYPELVN